MPVEMNQGSGEENPSQSTLGRGHFVKGKWHCECDRVAQCKTTKKTGPNKGRRCTIGPLLSSQSGKANSNV
jgi:hypothetical protein